MSPVCGRENLKREIGVWALALAILNITVGTGIFVIPAIIAENLGGAAILAYFVCGILIFLIALCLAEVGSSTNSSGGVYSYIETAFGPYAGFIANNIYWIGASVVADAALANALADTLKPFFPFLDGHLFRILFFLFIFGGLAFLNIRSVKDGIRFVELAALGKLIPLIVIIIAGAAFVNTSNLAWTSVPDVEHVGTASLLLFYAFMGLEGPLSNGGEIKNAKRTVPIAIFFGIGLVLILYIAIQLVTQGVLGNNIIAHKEAPLAAVAGTVFGKMGIVLVVIISAIAMLGNLGGDLLCLPRILFAGGRDGLMPKILAKVHPKFFTPYIAVIWYAGCGLLLAVLGAFKQLAVMASASILLIYLGVVLASIRLRKKPVNENRKTFRVPGGAVIPLLASAGIVWLLSGLSARELISICIFIAAFSIIYILMKIAGKGNDEELSLADAEQISRVE